MFESPDQIVDLSNPIDESIPTWPTFEPVRCEQTDWAARDGFTMERIEMASHTATHVDAPRHFIPEGRTLDDFSIEKFMGEGVVLDLAPKEPENGITKSEIEQYESEIQSGDVVMLHTGWDEHYGRTPEYLFEFPFLTGEAAEYLASQSPKAVGIDTASVGGWVDEAPAHGPATDVQPDESHLPLLENDIIPIEELRNLDTVLDGQDSRRAFFCYTPLNYQGTGGGSVRAFAML
ncbi:cyclase family protein [Haloarcula amylovorans]|uniref:cyclase family protein n=1 Tax=Haloarcula amylovorans TaxID=2562280 RepID=UPI001076448C|nr:cyclase family protein [Halomicroarcula amylolytica]